MRRGLKKYSYGDEFLTRDELLQRSEILNYLRRNGKERNEANPITRFNNALHRGKINKDVVTGRRNDKICKRRRNNNICKQTDHEKRVESNGQKMLSYCVVSNPLTYETTTDYDKLMSDFLASDKSEKYKNMILSLLNYDYSKAKDKAKKRHIEDEMKSYNGTLGSELVGINIKKLGIKELQKIAKNRWVKNYIKLRKQELIKKIESIKQYFRNKDEE